MLCLSEPNETRLLADAVSLIGSQHARYTMHIVEGRRELGDITCVKAT